MNPWELPLSRFLSLVQHVITQLPSTTEDKEYRKFIQQVTGPLTTMRKPSEDPFEDLAPSWWVSDDDASQSNAQALAQLRRRG